LVGDYLFEYAMGSSFQNNRFALPLTVNYIRDLIFACMAGATHGHIVDPYCGAGLFAISLPSGFQKVAAVELLQTSIASAKRDAQLNSNIVRQNILPLWRGIQRSSPP